MPAMRAAVHGVQVVVFLGFILQNCCAGPAGSASLPKSENQIRDGVILRGPLTQKRIALLFTGHEFGEGGSSILEALAAHRAKASFFLTGTFLTNREYSGLVKRIIAEGHYLGPHSDQHLLYCSWTPEKKTLVTATQFRDDLLANLRKIQDLGVKEGEIRYFLPPYEHCNREIADWTRQLNLQLVNYSPGTRSHADYAGEAEKNFISSAEILQSILSKEKADPNGLNGFLLLLHLGAGPARKDKFHPRFTVLLDELTRKGYEFVRLDQLL